MASNRGFGGGNLTTDDLEVGQKLIHAQTSHWGNSITNILELTVARKTKTRVILEDSHGKQWRMLVDVNYDNRIRSAYEGQGEYADPFYIYTEDDPELANLRSRAARYKAEKQARDACAVFDKDRTIATARAAIVALEQFIEIEKKEAS